mmetsp:Transcript_3675/g.8719  ORF Transcript_3675/g.8719 Transcript_3675/m.8719 type:complete len:267 (+) Transcript_3675:4206-5006(+)
MRFSGFIAYLVIHSCSGYRNMLVMCFILSSMCSNREREGRSTITPTFAIGSSSECAKSLATHRSEAGGQTVKMLSIPPASGFFSSSLEVISTSTSMSMYVSRSYSINCHALSFVNTECQRDCASAVRRDRGNGTDSTVTTRILSRERIARISPPILGVTRATKSLVAPAARRVLAHTLVIIAMAGPLPSNSSVTNAVLSTALAQPAPRFGYWQRHRPRRQVPCFPQSTFEQVSSSWQVPAVSSACFRTHIWPTHAVVPLHFVPLFP